MGRDNLELRQLEPENDKINSVEVYHAEGFREREDYIVFHIQDSDIMCSNKGQVKEAMMRRGKEYFDDVSNLSDSIYLEIEVSQTFLTGHTLPKHLFRARDKGEKALKNTVDDVFGVGCVGVE